MAERVVVLQQGAIVQDVMQGDIQEQRVGVEESDATPEIGQE
jgi:ABC-type uncharacterized transport system ATPase component